MKSFKWRTHRKPTGFVFKPMFLTMTLYGGRNCIKLVLAPFAAKNGLSISVWCIAPFLLIILFQFTWWVTSSVVHWVIYFHSSATIEIKSGAVDSITDDHRPQTCSWNSVSAAVYKLVNTIFYLKAIKYLNIRPRQIC